MLTIACRRGLSQCMCRIRSSSHRNWQADYLTKPFSVSELLARIKAIFRRVDALAEQAKDSAQPLRFGDVLSVDPRSREVRVRGETIALTHKEFDLLLHFARNPGRVYTRAYCSMPRGAIVTKVTNMRSTVTSIGCASRSSAIRPSRSCCS